jgi:uncharacterized caspase-like protein
LFRAFSLCMIILLHLGSGIEPACAQDRGPPELAGSENTPRNKRRALIVGNSTYVHAPPLANGSSDAAAVADALRDLSFEVTVGLDVDGATFQELVASFRRQLNEGDVTLFYYAGHGLQLNGQNYLIPIDAQLRRPADLALEAERLDDIIAAMTVEQNTAIVLLDACRDNPFARQLAGTASTRKFTIGEGLGAVDAGTGVYIGFATQPGNVALDGGDGHSPFATALLKRIATPSIDIEILMRRVRMDVMSMTKGQQVPWSNSSLVEPGFAFNPGAAAATRADLNDQPTATHSLDLAFWDSVRDTSEAAMFRAYLNAFPRGNFAAEARSKLARLEPPTSKKPIATSKPAPSKKPVVSEKPRSQPRVTSANPPPSNATNRAAQPTLVHTGRCIDGNIERCRQNCRQGRRGACRMFQKLQTSP